MKKSIGVFITLVCIVVSTSTVFAQSAGEHITHFDVTARINTDATIDVRESIVYDFSSNEKHGIYRDIPRKYTTEAGNQTVKFSNILVEDEKGTPYTFVTSNKGNNIEIKIGDANTTITGVHTYIISYKADRVIGYFKNYDELYWNATGNEWQVPIDNASATLYLPKDFKESEIQNACYFGPKGSTEQCPIVTMKTGDMVHAVNFAINSLQAGEGLTVATGFPKGIVHEPTFAERAWNLITDNWILGLPVLVFIWIFRKWWNFGKDPKGRGTIVPEYDIPDGLTPLEVDAILHQGIRNNALSAEIIYWATRGYIHINRLETKGFLKTNVDYELQKLKEFDDIKTDFDQYMLSNLFSYGIQNILQKDGIFKAVGTLMQGGAPKREPVSTIKISDLKNTFYTYIQAIKDKTYASVVAKGYFSQNPERVRNNYIGLAVACFFFAFFIGIPLMDRYGFLVFLSILVSGVIIFIFAFIMPARTQTGAEVRERIEGLKLYIKVAEEDRIKFHNAPEKNPELFEKLLPFAMIFGLEKEWAKQFEGILKTPPNWYSDPSGRAFSAVLFSNNLSSFSSAASSTLSSAPGGSSGSGGGGSSGGGGGGGGGGSW